MRKGDDRCRCWFMCVCVSGIVIFECGVSKKAGQILNNKHCDDTPNLLI